MDQKMFHLRFQRQKNDLINQSTKVLIKDLYDDILSQLNDDNFEELIYCSLEKSAKCGYFYATKKDLNIDLNNFQDLFDIGIFILESFELFNQKLNKSFFPILLSSIERGFFYGYLCSGKAISKSKKNNIIKFPLTGTHN